jgi:acyl carrier protein
MITPDQLYAELEPILELPPGFLKGDELLENLNWDSMAVVMFIAIADSKFGVTVSVSDIRDATTVRELYETLER